MNSSSGALRVYYCYAAEDEDLRNQLTAHLSPLRRARKLTIWFDRQILAGSDWELEVEKQLKEADLILLLVSSDFMNSDYCYNLQLTAALNHYEAGKVEIIPILLRSVLWEETPIKRLPRMVLIYWLVKGLSRQNRCRCSEPKKSGSKTGGFSRNNGYMLIL